MRIKDLEQYSGIYDLKDQLKRWVYERSALAFDAGDLARDALASPSEVEVRQAYIRQRFLEGIGGLPPMDTPLLPEVAGVVPSEGYRVEKVLFHSRPDTRVTANLYVPDDVRSPRGAVLFLCGHFDQAKHHPNYQMVCQYLVRSGLVVLAIDPVGQGERQSYYEPGANGALVPCGVSEHDYAGSQCLPLGDGLARYFLHDAMRAVDYLMTRPEVDPARIGVTGNSGGGTQTSMVMMADPRIAAAAPATFIMNRRTYMYAGGAQDAEQIWPGFTAAGLDHEDILLAMAPKPVLVLAVNYDFFPIEGTRQTVSRTRRFWEMFGQGTYLDYAEDATNHRYTERLASAAARFFSKHLLGTETAPSDSEIRTVEPSLLWCTRSGQLQTESGGRIVHHENLDRADGLAESRAALRSEERRDRALEWLKSKVAARRGPCDLNPRLNMRTGYIDNLAAYNAVWWSQPGMLSYAGLFRDIRYEQETLPVTIAIWEGGTSSIQHHIAWIRQACSEGTCVMVLDVSGCGSLMPHPLSQRDPAEFYEILHKLACDLIWLDDSLAAVRTYDVLRALDVLAELPHIDTASIRMYGHGNHGIYAQLASVLDERVRSVQWDQAMTGIGDWVKAKYYDSRDIYSVILPGMLHYCDLADLREWGTRKNRS